MDGGSTHRLRSNLDDSVYQSNSLLHTRETETSPFLCRFQVESSSQIADEKVNLTCVFPQLYFNPSHPAVLGWRVRRFLYNSKKAKPDFSWKRDFRFGTLKLD